MDNIKKTALFGAAFFEGDTFMKKLFALNAVFVLNVFYIGRVSDHGVPENACIFGGVNYIGEPSFARRILLVVVFTKGISRIITLVICL